MSACREDGHGRGLRARAAALFASGRGSESAARELGVSPKAVRKWQLTYRAAGKEGLLRMGRKHTAYDFETKVAAASAVVDGGMAKPEAMERLLDVTPGSVSIMGLMNDPDNLVQLVIDEDVLKDSYIGCHPCINTSSLKIATEDIVNKYLPAVHHEPIVVHLENLDIQEE